MRRSLKAATSLAVVVLALAMLPATASAITRDSVLARGQVWVNAVRVDPVTGITTTGVPYSQGKWALEDGSPVPTSAPVPSQAGYRTDCSGFVSMAYNLRDTMGRPYSTSTYDMGVNKSSLFHLTPITQAEMQPGDILLKSKVWYGGDSGHVIIFAGWSKPDMSEYWALEQTGPCTIYHTRPWGQTGYRTFKFDAAEDEYADVQERVNGADRYSTAAAASLAAFPATSTTSVPALVVASGENWPDALGGAALSGSVGGPLLLTGRKSLAGATAAEIVRLKPARVYVLGGEPTVGSGVMASIASLSPTLTVTRLGGPNRYDVAATVARVAVAEAAAKGSVIATAYVATGLTFPDALAASPISAKTGWPILLTKPAALMPGPAAALRDLKIKNVVILGGTNSVTPAVETQLRKMGISVTRIADTNRYNTAIRIARHGAGLGVGLSWDKLGIASGSAFADALSGGAAQGRTGALMVLTPGAALDPGVRALLVENRAVITKTRVFGGIKTITKQTRAALASVLRTGQ